MTAKTNLSLLTILSMLMALTLLSTDLYLFAMPQLVATLFTQQTAAQRHRLFRHSRHIAHLALLSERCPFALIVVLILCYFSMVSNIAGCATAGTLQYGSRILSSVVLAWLSDGSPMAMIGIMAVMSAGFAWVVSRRKV